MNKKKKKTTYKFQDNPVETIEGYNDVMEEIRDSNIRRDLAAKGVTGIAAETIINDEKTRRKYRRQLEQFMHTLVVGSKKTK